MFRSFPRLRVLRLLCLLLALGAMILTGPTPVAAGEGMGPAEIAKHRINIAGRQRMLSQRIAKAVCINRLGIAADAQAHQAETALEEFERVLNGLRHGDAGLNLQPERAPQIADQLDRVATAWTPFRADVAAVLGGQGARVGPYAAGAATVLAEMAAAVGVMEEAYGAGLVHPDLARALNLSGRQRMLSQKALKEYCFAALDGAPAEARAQLQDTLAQFDAAQAGLIQGDPGQGILQPPTWELMAQLDGVQVLWQALRPELARVAGGGVVDRTALARMVEESERLLTELNTVVWMYESF